MITKKQINIYYLDGTLNKQTTIRYKKCGKDEAMTKAKQMIEQLKMNNPNKFTGEVYVKTVGDKHDNDVSMSVNKYDVYVSVMSSGKRVYKQIKHTNRSVNEAIELAEEFINQFD